MTPEERKHKEDQALLAVRIEAEGLPWEYRFISSDWNEGHYRAPLHHVGSGHEIRLKELRWEKEREAYERGERVEIRFKTEESQGKEWGAWEMYSSIYAPNWTSNAMEFRIPHKWQAAMDARAAGKPIEWRHRELNVSPWSDWKLWIDDEIRVWNKSDVEFRPQAESSYRPWTFETCPMGIFLMRKECKQKTMIISIAKNGCNLDPWKPLFENWTQLDGTPAGEKIE